MRVVLSALGTLMIAAALFAIAMPAYNHASNAGDIGRAFRFLLMPFVGQLFLLAAGAIYSSRTKTRDVFNGILYGFGLELAVLGVLSLISASAHY